MLDPSRHFGVLLWRLKRHDSSLKYINVRYHEFSGSQLDEMIDCLDANPHVIENLSLMGTQLADGSGVKIAQYIATSFTIAWVDLRFNRFEMDTYLALAKALRVNTSLRAIFLCHNAPVYQPYIDQAFVDALRINPDRPVGLWWLYTHGQCEYARLKRLAEEAGHPTLQMLLLEKA